MKAVQEVERQGDNYQADQKRQREFVHVRRPT
jgi:hypothetical protein